MFPSANPTSQIGQLESEIRRLKSEIGSKANNYEINTLRNRVDCVEHFAEGIRAQIEDLSYMIQVMKEEIKHKE